MEESAISVTEDNTLLCCLGEVDSFVEGVEGTWVAYCATFGSFSIISLMDVPTKGPETFSCSCFIGIPAGT